MKKSPTHIYNSAGLYIVQLTSDIDSNGICPVSYYDSVFVIDPNNSSTHISNNQFDDIEIFYSSGSLVITDNDQIFNYVSLHDISGRLIFESNFQKEIPMSEIQNGIYIVTLKSPKTSFSKKIYISFY
jgi:hypothetical protein